MNKPHKHAELIKAWADGAEIEQMSQGPICSYDWISFRGVWHDGQAYRIKPEREYPKTSLTGNELITMFTNCLALSGDNWRGSNVFSDIACANFANQVIRRFVDDQENKE